MRGAAAPGHTPRVRATRAARLSPPASLVTLAVLAMACEGTGMPADAPAMQRGVGVPRAAPRPTPAAEPPPPPPVAPADFRAGPAPGDAIAEAAVEAPAPAPERDLPGELSVAFGVPSGCLDADAVRANAPRLDLTVGAYVSTTGLVTRADVAGGTLSDEARACLVRHTEALRFAGPVPDAPRRVNARVTLALRPPPEAPADERPEWKLPAGARAPGLVLPARAGEGPAPGSVGASRTLPAQVGEGPAPGAVSPGLVLPAQGGSGSSVAIGE